MSSLVLVEITARLELSDAAVALGQCEGAHVGQQLSLLHPGVAHWAVVGGALLLLLLSLHLSLLPPLSTGVLLSADQRGW